MEKVIILLQKFFIFLWKSLESFDDRTQFIIIMSLGIVLSILIFKFFIKLEEILPVPKKKKKLKRR